MAVVLLRYRHRQRYSPDSGCPIPARDVPTTTLAAQSRGTATTNRKSSAEDGVGAVRCGQELCRVVESCAFPAMVCPPRFTIIFRKRGVSDRLRVMLGTQPIIQVLAIYQAFNFGTFYLLISGFPLLWEGRYGMARGQASLNYLSLAIGFLIGVNICGPVTDRIYASLKRRRGLGVDEPGVPEFRMPLMVPASIITPAAIFLYGWSAHAKMHFMVPNIAAGLFAAGSIICYQCISAYISDAYTLHSASASAACAFLRSTLAFIFPLFVPALFGNLGYGIGGSIVGSIAIVLGIPAPWIIWRYGAGMRGSSRFAVDEKV